MPSQSNIFNLHSANVSKPTVSVIIAARNEEKFITDCIMSVLNNDWPREQLDILVVDHSSVDSTAALARAAGATVLPLSNGNIGAVRNVGLRAAKGEYVAYIDADCIAPEYWLRTAIQILEADKNVGAVGGPYMAPVNGTWVEKSLAPSQLPHGVIKPTRALATGSFISHAYLLREIGEFDETLISGEDDDICNRIQRSGLAVISATDCHVIHRGFAKTWRDVIKKEKWHGSNHVDVRSSLDPTLILTLMFLGASFALPILLATVILTRRGLSLYIFLCVLFAQFIPPLLFALKRIRQTPHDWPLTLYLVGTGYAYFTGHGLGVLSNLWRRAIHRK